MQLYVHCAEYFLLTCMCSGSRTVNLHHGASVLARVLTNAYNTPLVACSLAVVAWSICSWTFITLPCDFYTKTALVSWRLSIYIYFDQ